MNFVFILFSGVLLLSGLSLLIDDEVVVIPLRGQLPVSLSDSNIDSIADQYEDTISSTKANIQAFGGNESSGGTNHINALEHFVLANKAQQHNDIQNTILHLVEALLIDPSYKDARLQLVESYLSSGQRASAEQVLDQAMNHNPEASVLLAMRVRMFIQDGDLQTAFLVLENGLKRFKDDEELLVLAASIDDQLGYYTKAAKVYGQLTMMNPVKLNYQVGQAMAMDQAGDIDTATMLYQMIAQKLVDAGERLAFVDQRLAMLTSTAD
ncbi:MAG: tetratricopeptide repeat protein [Methylococcales bacterium]